MIRVGILGYGYWGPNIARNFSEIDDVQIAVIGDPNPARLRLAQKRHPLARLTAEPQEVVKDPSVDIVAVVTPVGTHYQLAYDALRFGKDVLVAKPLTTSTRLAQELIETAEKHQRVLAVDHTFVYSSAVQKIKELTQSGALGEVLYYDSTRINLGIFQSDVNVLWDLAAHDFAILDYLFPTAAAVVNARGVNHYSLYEHMAYIIVELPNRLLAHIHVNWLAPTKVRTLLIGGTKRMIVYDDTEPSEKVKVYDKGIAVTREDRYHALVQYRIGDMFAPRIDSVEALRTECLDFVKCVQTRSRPVADAEHALRVVRLLEAAQTSMERRVVDVQVAV